MKRREFIAGVGAAAGWSAAVRAQTIRTSLIGFLNSGRSTEWSHLVAAFRQGLQETGYVEGQNVAIEYRWADGRNDRLPALAAELVQREVNLIVTGGGELSAIAAKNASATIPIAFTNGGDPVKAGLVKSLNLPGGNITGVGSFTLVTGSKRLGLLNELVRPKKVAVLMNPENPSSALELADLQEAATAYGHELLVLNAVKEADIVAAFSKLRAEKASGLVVQAGTVFTTHRESIVAGAANQGIPTIYSQREFPAIGGFMSYGVSFPDVYRNLGIYAGRILKGEHPADLPVLLPTKFEFVINLKTAKMLGIAIPPTTLAIANEVIE